MLDLDPGRRVANGAEDDLDLGGLRAVAPDMPQVREPVWRLERDHLAPLVLGAG